MALTSTLCGAPSLASTLVSARPAARDIEVGTLSARGALAPMLSTLMMRPQRRSFICGEARRMSRMAANSFCSRSQLQHFVGELLERTGARRAGVVDEDVDLAERPHRLVIAALEVGGDPDVGLHAGDARPSPSS